MAINRAASLAEASAVLEVVGPATDFLPAAFSVTASVPAAVYVPWYTTTGTPTVGVVGAVAGEDHGGLPLPAEIFKLARSLGMAGLPL